MVLYNTLVNTRDIFRLAMQVLAGSEINYDTLQKCVGTQDFYFRDFGIPYPSNDFIHKHR